MSQNNSKKMEVNENLSQYSNSNSTSIMQIVSLWKFINKPFIAICSDMKNAAAEQMLRSLLESMLKGPSNLINVLIPPCRIQDKGLQKQYTNFTSWLFGTIFYITSVQTNKDVLEYSIEVQGSMLSILASHRFTAFDIISSEYILILYDILHLENSKMDSISLSRFQTEGSTDDDLDLTSFPLVINSSRAIPLQIYIFKIIMKSDITIWNQAKLWEVMSKMLRGCHPEVKIVVLQLCTEILKFCDYMEQEQKLLITYVIEITKALPTWMNLGLISKVNIGQYIEVFIHLIELTSPSLHHTELCLQLIDLSVDALIPHQLSLEHTSKLQQVACKSMTKYLTKTPRCCTSSEVEKFTRICTFCPEFISVCMHFVLADAKNVLPNTRISNTAGFSELWLSLKELLKKSINCKAYEQSLHIIQASNLLESWLVNQKITLQLYGDYLGIMLDLFLQELDFEECIEENIIFENMIHLMMHRDAKKLSLQRFLSLPFIQKNYLTENISKRVLQVAKSLDIKTKIRCLNVLCQFGSGRELLDILNICVLSNETQLAVHGVLNSVLLLEDDEITVDDILQQVLVHALSSNVQEVQEALVEALGRIVCFLSRNAVIVRHPMENIQWMVQCTHCKEPKNKEMTSDTYMIPKNYDVLLKKYLYALLSGSTCIRSSLTKNFISFSNHMESFSSNEIARLWIPYIRDKDSHVRNNVAKVIGKLLSNKILVLKNAEIGISDGSSTDLNEFVDLVIDMITNSLVEAMETSNHCLHNTVLITAKNFVCTPSNLIERRIVNIFFLTILDPMSIPTAITTATTAYKDFANFLGISPKMLYIRYKKEFLKLIMQRAVCNYITHSYNIATSVHRIAKCVGYRGSRELLRKDGQYAVPFLIVFVVDTPKAIALLHDVAELISMNERQMLIEYFPYICSHAFLNIPADIGTACLKLVRKIICTDFLELIRRFSTSIFSELMLSFYEGPKNIGGFLEIIAEQEGCSRTNFGIEKQFVSYLKPRLHGILVNFDMNLGPKSDEYTQQSALRSLTTLMQFVGAECLIPLKYKILGTLRTSLNFQRPNLGLLACDAWDAFLHNIPAVELGPLLPTICVSMISLLEKYPSKANSMLSFLIIQNNEALSNDIAELFFIDDIRASQQVIDVVTALIIRERPESFEANLKLWLKRIIHETDEVRLRAVRHLQIFLSEHRCELNDMILSSTDAHPLIVELLDTLLTGCQDKNETLRLLYGECLGELGAIEPSLLPRRIVTRDDSKFIFDVNEEFACAMLLEFIRAFQMQKSTQSMDCFALAIQEVLKAYEITPNGKNAGIWNSLPSMTQQMISPFLTSCYRPRVIDENEQLPHPVYGSEAGASVESWAINWLHSICVNVHDETLRQVLRSWTPAFKRDMKIIIFCLPYIICHVIVNGREAINTKIREEMLTVISTKEEIALDPELVRLRPVRHENLIKGDDLRISDEVRSTRCSQVIFSILDHLQRWLRERRLKHDEKFSAIQRFCSHLDSLIIAEGCYQSREYHRALMYLEQHMVSSNKGLSDSKEGGLLAKIYAQLDEPDGVSGILATQEQCPTLQQLVLAHEVSGQLQDAAICYERLAQQTNLKPLYLQGMIQCYLGLDQPYTAMNITQGVLNNRPELEPLIVEHEPFWRLAHFARLDDASQRTVKHSLLEDFKKGVMPDLASLRKNLVALLGSASHPGVYQQSYSYIMKLHVLNEFNKAATMMLTNMENLPTIFEEWHKRSQLLRTSRGIEFVLGMRRATLDLAVQLQDDTSGIQNSVLKEEIGKIWLQSAKIARKSGLYQQAYMYILSASDSCPPQELYIEQAQLYWQKGCQEDAFTTLKRCFASCFQPSSHYKQMSTAENVQERKQCAKAKLLFARYNDETVNVDTDGNISNYKEAIEVWRAWEKSLLACAQYYESIVNRMNDVERDIKARELQIHMMNYYGKSLQYGCKYVHQSMPRMLTIWLDFASRAASRLTAVHQDELVRKCQDCLTKMTKIIEVYKERLPTFMWLTAFSQLVSRICHPSPEVQQALCSILVKVVCAYPQQCLWMMASVYNSAHHARQKRCREILNQPQLRTLETSKLIQDFNKLWEKLIELSNKPIAEGVLNTNVRQLSQNLPRLLANHDFSPIMMPTSKFRQLQLPSKGSSHQDHYPFPLEWTHISGIEDSVVIMPSLQRPRRITLRGSDGKKYLFMCKPTDDLRRDFRLMEFNDIVNKYLQKNPESRQRRLYIRTYSVVPLNETCGLIEWVPNLVGLRPVLMNLYKERGLSISNRELKTMICAVSDPLEKKRQVFLEKLMPRHPPVLAEWFRLTFPDPYGWYEARTAYIRTTAVMSMVGYILGLGDRHGENILFDSKCGDCVHVDFNCLFNQGETFLYPERVPFRLTHNMVDAMGPLGYEGPFRRASQVTMRVLRQQSSTLLSVLTPFAYDPLVNWSKTTAIRVDSRRDRNNERNIEMERTNEKAVEHIKNIEQRLKGLVRSHGEKLNNIALNLSVEGQTNHLILEAVNVDNLCQMYYGWGPYL